MEQTVYLQLEDGTCLTGKHFGAPLKEDVIAEVVFTTAMIYRNADRPQLLRTDGRSDISPDRQLRRQSKRL